VKKGLKGFGQKVSNLFTKLVLSEQTAIEIGTPYNVQHVQHVQADAHSSTGFSVMFITITKNLYTFILTFVCYFLRDYHQKCELS
jgi:hypothetical protein